MLGGIYDAHYSNIFFFSLQNELLTFKHCETGNGCAQLDTFLAFLN